MADRNTEILAEKYNSKFKTRYSAGKSTYYVVNERIIEFTITMIPTVVNLD